MSSGMVVDLVRLLKVIKSECDPQLTSTEIPEHLLKTLPQAGNVDQWIKAIETELDNQNLSLGATHIMEGEDRLSKVVFWPPHVHHGILSRTVN